MLGFSFPFLALPLFFLTFGRALSLSVQGAVRVALGPAGRGRQRLPRAAAVTHGRSSDVARCSSISPRGLGECDADDSNDLRERGREGEDAERQG